MECHIQRVNNNNLFLYYSRIFNVYFVKYLSSFGISQQMKHNNACTYTLQKNRYYEKNIQVNIFGLNNTIFIFFLFSSEITYYVRVYHKNIILKGNFKLNLRKSDIKGNKKVNYCWYSFKGRVKSSSQCVSIVQDGK